MQTVKDVGFSLQEIEKVSRLKDIFVADKNLDDSTLLQHKLDLNTFVKQYELRRGLKVLEVYPELESFFKKIDYENTI